MGFTELADRVWVTTPAAGLPMVTVVAGSAGVVVVDAPPEATHTVVEGLARLGLAAPTALVLTHAHPAHAGGGAALRGAYAERPALVAHETAAEELATGATPGAVPADRTFSSALVLDLGDRSVELVHPGRAHTAGDLVVRVPDADVVVAGDLVASGPAAYGPDCWPLDWPRALDVVLQLLTPATVVVPGHGGPLDRDAVEEHRATLGIVAETVRDAAGRGVPAEAAVAETPWPWPAEAVAAAVRRGYAQLPRSQRRLPLL